MASETVDEETEAKNRRIFYWVLPIPFIFGVILLVLVLTWALKYGGGLQAFTTHGGLLGIHMSFMVLFMLLVNSTSTLVYRLLPTTRKFTTKLIHAGLHFITIVGASAGFAAAIDLHNKKHPPKHFHSVHSWLGLATLCIYYFQFFGGLIFYLLQIPGPAIRTCTIPIHRLIGHIILYFATGAVLTGLFNVSPESPAGKGLIPSALELNVAALLTIGLTFSVVCLITMDRFRRPTFAEVEPLLVQPKTPETIRKSYSRSGSTSSLS